MKTKFFSRMITDELSMLIPWSLILDSIIFLATLPVYKLGIQIPLGLALGTLTMIVNIIVLGLACERAVERPVASAKRFMFGAYILRMSIIGCSFLLAFHLECINPLAAIIPVFFPKIIYTASGFIKSKGG